VRRQPRRQSSYTLYMSIGHVLIDLEQIVWTQLKCVWLAVVLMPEDLSLHWWGDYAGRSAEPDDGSLPYINP